MRFIFSSKNSLKTAKISNDMRKGRRQALKGCEFFFFFFCNLSLSNNICIADSWSNLCVGNIKLLGSLNLCFIIVSGVLANRVRYNMCILLFWKGDILSQKYLTVNIFCTEPYFPSAWKKNQSFPKHSKKPS